MRVGETMSQGKTPARLTIGTLLRPHRAALGLGAAAVIAESVVDLLEPWPLKVIIDNVLRAQAIRAGWLNQLIVHYVGTEKLAILKAAALAYIAIACLGAISSYIEKYITTS